MLCCASGFPPHACPERRALCSSGFFATYAALLTMVFGFTPPPRATYLSTLMQTGQAFQTLDDRRLLTMCTSAILLCLGPLNASLLSLDQVLKPGIALSPMLLLERAGSDSFLVSSMFQLPRLLLSIVIMFLTSSLLQTLFSTSEPST